MLAAALLDDAWLRIADFSGQIASHRSAKDAMAEAHHRLRELVDPETQHPAMAPEAPPADRWKACIQILQLQASVSRVVAELSRSDARRVRYWWHAMTEVLAILRRKDYAAPRLPVHVPWWAPLRVRWLATFHKSAFHR